IAVTGAYDVDEAGGVLVVSNQTNGWVEVIRNRSTDRVLNMLNTTPAGVAIGSFPKPVAVGPEVTVIHNTTGLTSNASELDFGERPEGASETIRHITIRNDGDATLSLSNVTVSAGFEIRQQPATSIAPGASTQLAVAMLTSQPGPQDGELVIVTNDANESSFRIAVRGEVAGPGLVVRFGEPDGPEIIDGSQTAIDYGNVTIGGPLDPAVTFWVENPGTRELVISEIQTPDGIVLTSIPPIFVAPGNRHYFSTFLDNKTAGVVDGLITLQTNVPTIGEFKFRVTGEVLVPETAISSGSDSLIYNATVEFDTANAGEAGTRRTITLTNSGRGDLIVSQFHFNPGAAAGFTIVDGLASTIGPGESDDLVLELVTSASGIHEGELSFLTNDPVTGRLRLNLKGEVVAEPTGSFAGQVFVDEDGDGILDEGIDLGRSGGTLYIDSDLDGELDIERPGEPGSGERQTITEDDGSWRFDGLAAGTYVVRLVVPDGFSQTSPQVDADPGRVYVLSSGNSENDLAVQETLTEASLDVIIGANVPEWDGSQADLSEFDAAVVLNSSNWRGGSIPTSGQTSLRQFVEYDGGGLVTVEWLAWITYSDSGNPELEPLLPAREVDYLRSFGNTVMTQVTADAVLNDGLPKSFEFEHDFIDGGGSLLEPKDGATTFYSTDTGHAGLAGWNYGEGRVLSFSSFASKKELANPAYETLFANAVRWAVGGAGTNGELGALTVDVSAGATAGGSFGITRESSDLSIGEIAPRFTLEDESPEIEFEVTGAAPDKIQTTATAYETLSLELIGQDGSFAWNDSGTIRVAAPSGSGSFASEATFRLSTPLSNRGFESGEVRVSLESLTDPGQFVRHRNSFLHVDPFAETQLYRDDATFIVRPGLSGSGVSFESVNYRGQLIVEDSGRLRIAPSAEVVSRPEMATFRIGGLARPDGGSALIADTGLTIEGGGANRTLHVPLTEDASGTVVVAIFADEGQSTATRSVLVGVSPVNDKPAIAGIPNRNLSPSDESIDIPLVIADAETPVDQLSITVNSSNQDLFATLEITTNGNQRRLVGRIASGKSGPTTITISVSDGHETARTSFTLIKSGLEPPVNVAPTIDRLTATPNPVFAGETVRLTAEGVADSDGTVQEVVFYRELDFHFQV
ncbi:MAG: choice-of-anchor D domain-containing protein, partial [Planctomycetes bacterium]|nr:choice-of-anchor D domain-containing protein [Planctomycetota bacterium]